MATVRINNAIVKGISSPDSIRRIADEKGLNPQEVFVRLIFEVNGTEYSASNQLRFIGKKDYQKLVNAKQSGEPVDISVDIDKAFFYMNHDTSIDDLFKEDIVKKPVSNNLSDLLKWGSTYEDIVSGTF